MANPNFGALLDKPSSEIEKPKPLPQGSYVCVVRGLPKFDKSTKKQTEYVEFTYGILQAGDDVDADELEAAGGIAEKTIRDTYYITENSLWRLKEMLLSCGLEDSDDVSLRQMIEETPGKQLLVHIKHQASQDGTAVFANVGSTAPVE